MSNVLLITHWTRGDVLPFFRLGTELKKKGHRVTIFTHGSYEKFAREKNIEYIPLDTVEEYEEMNKDLPLLTDPVNNRAGSIYFHNKYHGKERLLREYNIISKYCKEKDTIILARHRSSISGLLVAEKYKLPYASVVLAPNYFSHMNLHEELFGDAIKDEINKAREELKLPLIHSWKEWLYSPKCILGIWPEWFASRDELWPEGAIPVGFMKEETLSETVAFEQSLVDFINKARGKRQPIVLISGGTSRFLSKDFYDISAKACTLAKCAGIIVTRYEDYVPTVLPPNIIWFRYVPLSALMYKVDVIIHHGGMGTLSEAVNAKLPQIILSHMIDGRENAGRLQSLGIARNIPKGLWDSREIAKALIEMQDETVKEKCTYYAKVNEEENKACKWETIIENLPPYEFVNSLLQENTKIANDSLIQKPSREQILALLKRNKKIDRD